MFLWISAVIGKGRANIQSANGHGYVIWRKEWLLPVRPTSSRVHGFSLSTEFLSQRVRAPRSISTSTHLFWGRPEPCREPWIQFFLCLVLFGAGTLRVCCSSWPFSSSSLITLRTGNQPASLQDRRHCQLLATYSLWTTSDYTRASCR